MSKNESIDVLPRKYPDEVLPRDFRGKKKFREIISEDLFRRYFELQRLVVMRWLMQFAGFRESLADDLFLAKLAMECGVGVFTKTASEYERHRKNFEVVFADVVIILLCLCVHVRSQEWSETYYSIRSFEIVRGFPVTSRRLDSHGMVEENRGEAALPSARPVLEMTAECGGANSSEHRLFVKKTCIE
ncbi:hypothetical protein F2Q69_00027646 [Brassica cretica]|uniref:Uncharacterized protein n=1 Tax=Brassica cretica TaxID=69181 RepID=A0A8S9RZ14_BRACR|nr:hypothetical protein F2Q69_00027646 [Brassica cretica]